MYCKKVVQAGNDVYAKLVGLAFTRGIDVYEIDSPDSIRGIYHSYLDEGIDAKVFMVGREWGKEYVLARMLTYYVLHKSQKAFILSDNTRVTELSEKADRMAFRLYVYLNTKKNKAQNKGKVKYLYL